MRTKTKSDKTSENSVHPDRLELLEELVDELIKESPGESRIRGYMEAVGLTYTADPILRMTRVLEELEIACDSTSSGHTSKVSSSKQKGGDHDRSL
jgi:hypothetical protein